MPNTDLTRYRLVVNDMKDLAVDLKDIAQDTQENISWVRSHRWQGVSGKIAHACAGMTPQTNFQPNGSVHTRIDVSVKYKEV